MHLKAFLSNYSKFSYSLLSLGDLQESDAFLGCGLIGFLFG